MALEGKHSAVRQCRSAHGVFSVLGTRGLGGISAIDQPGIFRAAGGARHDAERLPHLFRFLHSVDAHPFPWHYDGLRGGWLGGWLYNNRRWCWFGWRWRGWGWGVQLVVADDSKRGGRKQHHCNDRKA